MTQSSGSVSADSQTIFGHHPGLFVLFFAELWERFSYYGMRALLVFYMTKGFLGYGDDLAYSVYAAYTALVYATPYVGGMLADRLLGSRRAVILGGVLMAAGHLLLTFQNLPAFYGALALIICGNGFFKPNISTMVGGLYPRNPEKRDGAFTIFYMGINLGAAVAPLLCGYIGETHGWHYGFGLATLGMLIGLAVFVTPPNVTRILIGLGALLAAVTMVLSVAHNPVLIWLHSFLALALLAAAAIAMRAVGLGSLPDHVGRPPDPAVLHTQWLGPLSRLHAVYLGTLLAVPTIAYMVYQQRIAGTVLSIFGVVALGMLLYEAFRATLVERHRLFVAMVLMFFGMLFWAFFEQAGSSINNFTDRNVDRVVSMRTLTAEDVGTTIELQLTQAQLGLPIQGQILTLDQLLAHRKAKTDMISLPITEAHLGMEIAPAAYEIPASTYQSANAIFILLFGLLFAWAWAFTARRGIEPPAPLKFGLGLIQLGLGFWAMWFGATQADSRGMVAMSWLLLGYLLHTTGELCVSPVGLSMMTKLSPKRLGSTIMGAWFLASAFANLVGGEIAKLTSVSGDEADTVTIPPPKDSLDIYGNVFYQIGIAAMVSGLLVIALMPLLRKWMHEEEPLGET